MPSRVIKDFSYDAPTRRLDVCFVSGRHYSYFGVPADIAQALRAAPSKGEFFNIQIRGRYRFARRSDLLASWPGQP